MRSSISVVLPADNPLMNAAPPQVPPATQLATLRAVVNAAPEDLEAHMCLGAALHACGQLEQALIVFERARALDPASTDAAAGCATMLFELNQPEAALKVLLTVEAQLLQSADGAANLAIAREACGQIAEAKVAYAQALTHKPNHVRSLNNMAILAARENRWTDAVGYSARCVELVGTEPHFWINLADMLAGQRDYAGGLGVLAQAVERFPELPELRLRQAVMLSFNAEFDRAHAVLSALGPAAEPMLRDYLNLAIAAGGRADVTRPDPPLPTPRELFTHQAYDAIRQCDWRYNNQLTTVLREMLADANRTGQPRDWRDAQFYGLMLPLNEDEVGRIRELTGISIWNSYSLTAAPSLKRRAPARDARLRIGVMAQSLRDPRFANSLARQLALHDASRFAIHVYAPTPRPQASLVEPLALHAASVTETGHMSVDEVVARVRLDDLDLLLDTTFYTPWCRPEVTLRRVAPVQVQQLTWQRHHPQHSSNYNMSDPFLHPDSANPSRYGVIARLPHTLWLACNDDLPAAPVTRPQLGLAEDMLVLCSFLPSLAIDPETFALWMQALRALPDALLMLPAYPPQTQENLRREAGAAGVLPGRIAFITTATRTELLGCMQLADLFVDSLRLNANHGLVDALRMGVPAVTCAGQSMASRLGGSIIRAAGLPDCVLEDRGAYLKTIVRLGRDRNAIQTLRTRLAAARPTAPLFDTARRVKEWESAWTHMIAREQAGLLPESFDI
jgi:protein O-GlcNAc transferase